MTKLTLILLWLSVLASQAQLRDPRLTLTIKNDRPDAIYEKGQAATFQIEAPLTNLTGTSVVATLEFTKDLHKTLLKTQVTLINGKGTASFTLEEPGFVNLKAVAAKMQQNTSVGFSPESIAPSMPTPADFADFWRDQKAALAKIPLSSNLTAITAPSVNVQAFDVQLPCLGAPVSGFFGRPKTAKPGTLPAILFLADAGVFSAKSGSLWWALKEGGMLVMDINAHGIPNDRTNTFYQALSQNELRDYRYIGRTNRNDCYYKGMFLRAVRAIDFLTAQPEWDGKTVIVYGVSQGGWQAFAAAGIDPRVTFLCAAVPAGCDHTGLVVDRAYGWPHLVADRKRQPPIPEEVETARYFDSVNFAALTQCKGAAVTVGFLDTVCAPTTVFTAYNALKVPKQIHKETKGTHRNTPAADKFLEEAALAHIRQMKAVR